jgi:putative restriction endonuclease
MTGVLSALTVSRLQKAATDNGFDCEMGMEDEWLAFTSTQCPLRIWLSAVDDTSLLIAFSEQSVVVALGEYGIPIEASIPANAVDGRSVSGVPALHRLVQRALQLSKSLPNELLKTFAERAISLPRTTEAERLVVQRIGQNLFREGLMQLWEARCAMTGLSVPELLRASHIKPWAECGSDAERLDVYNGFLLAPNLDAAFDHGFITVSDEGSVIVSASLETEARTLLGLDRGLRVSRHLTDTHRRYLSWHRASIFLR